MLLEAFRLKQRAVVSNDGDHGKQLIEQTSSPHFLERNQWLHEVLLNPSRCLFGVFYTILVTRSVLVLYVGDLRIR